MPKTESTIRRDQLIAPPEEFMDIDGLSERLQKGGHKRPEAFAILKDYLAIQNTLPIDDGPMRRICEVMTNNGCITTESCEGHGQDVPRIFFHVRSLDALENMAYFLRKASSQKHFLWEITVQPKFNSNPSNPLPVDFILQPVPRKNELLDPLRDRNLLLLDIHYMEQLLLAILQNRNNSAV